MAEDKSAHVRYTIVKSHGARESLAAMPQPTDMYFKTELFLTAKREQGPLSRITNCEK
jgi:hypothetical protein